MKVISNAEFGGERPLFESHDLRLENVIIRAGESAIKECSNIEAVDCRFEGNYPFWHVHGFVIDRCFFDVGGRSALWYSDHLKMTNTRIDAPKMFREMHDIEIENVELCNIYKKSIYQQRASRIPLSAFPLLVWQRTISVEAPTSSSAHFTILWDTVFVKSTRRSGHPIFFPKSASICVNTLHLHL